MSGFSNLPTPPELFRQFEHGELSREELQSFMALHARGLLSEMEEERQQPKQSYLERLRNYAAARRLAKRHGPALLRQVLAALGRIPGFPPAQILWNADHGDVPLHCFFRVRKEPVFRIVKWEKKHPLITLEVEYGHHSASRTTRERVVLECDAALSWRVRERDLVSRS